VTAINLLTTVHPIRCPTTSNLPLATWCIDFDWQFIRIVKGEQTKSATRG